MKIFFRSIRALTLPAFFAAFILQLAPNSHAQPDLVGQWGAVQNWPIVSVHSVLLPTGKVMFYPYGDDPYLWDPANSSVTQLPRVGYNIFCTGHSILADGRVLITGGHIENNRGLNDASYYDPFANTWTRLPDMNDGRWYPTSTVLPNGDILVVSGDRSAGGVNDLPQVWQVGSGTWRNLTGATQGQPLYPKMFLAPNGRVFFAGDTSQYLDTAGSGSWSTVGNRRVFGRDNYGSAAMYDDGRVVYIGGADAPVASAEIINLNAATPSWTLVGSMAQPRRQHNATLLPDGKVLVTGGSSAAGFDTASGAVRAAEMWDPATGNFTTMASFNSSVYRGYHSTAMLLPDARVLSSGGDNNPTAEIYSPPYLFRGARPTISSAPSAVSYSETFFVGTPDGASISSVTWLRLSAVTHTMNMDQRINRLAFSQTTGGLNVTAPGNVNLCPPGHYMLFVLNGNGVPSVSRMVRISNFGAPPSAPTGLTATPGIQKVNLSWNSSPTATSYNVKRSTTSGGPYTTIAPNVTGTSYSDTAVSVGTTYFYVVSAVNPTGESPNSNQASAAPLAGGTGAGLAGQYYDNIDFTILRVTRTDPTINFDWGTGSPDPSIGVDTFSVRWTGQIEPLFSQTYTFYTETDDGVRLWINNVLVIDRWIDQGPTEWSGTISLSAGQRYDIRMDYYENGGGAVGRLRWSSASQLKEIVPQSQLYPGSGSGSPPTAPTGLTAIAQGKKKIVLNWTQSSTPGITGNRVYRSTTSGGPYSLIATLNPTTFSNTGLTSGTTYYYVVTAVNANGESPNSNQASARAR